MDLGTLFQQVTGLINSQTREAPSVDTNNLLSQVAGLFQQHANATGQILPASRDPLGDPADQEGNILPASMDPLGDPADQR
jgi:hypothetical protein